MARSRPPSMPSMSGELITKGQSDFKSPEILPLVPAAWSSPTYEAQSSGRSSASSENQPSVLYLPVSPASPGLSAAGRTTKPPRQIAKRPLADLDLPPPPTRTRKIIQMKPKTSTKAKSAMPPSSNGAKETKESPAKTPSTSTSAPATLKKKQPSATSAAGRKIARKTAHSLIERRRRSKMNEEFATLKNMIPACRGQEMHKLAILQASIDYVNYLEQCIQDLKAADSSTRAKIRSSGLPSPTSPDLLAGVNAASAGVSAHVSPDLLPQLGTHTTGSPSFSPGSHAATARTTYEFAPTVILPSPALGPTCSPEPAASTTYRWAASASVSASPALQPQRDSVSPHGAETDIDHEASTALLMLNRDRRGTLDSIDERFSVASLGPLALLMSGSAGDDALDAGTRKKVKLGMSVRDLLIS